MIAPSANNCFNSAIWENDITDKLETFKNTIRKYAGLSIRTTGNGLFLNGEKACVICQWEPSFTAAQKLCMHAQYVGFVDVNDVIYSDCEVVYLWMYFRRVSCDNMYVAPTSILRKMDRESFIKLLDKAPDINTGADPFLFGRQKAIDARLMETVHEITY